MARVEAGMAEIAAVVAADQVRDVVVPDKEAVELLHQELHQGIVKVELRLREQLIRLAVAKAEEQVAQAQARAARSLVVTEQAAVSPKRRRLAPQAARLKAEALGPARKNQTPMPQQRL